MIAPQPDVPPNQTLYLSNLNEKVRIDDLKRAIYDTFSQFGPILDIIAQRNLRMKGQAFVVFQDLNHACVSHRAMQGFVFFSKPMRVQFAKGKSDAVAKLDGTYLPRERGPFVEEKAAEKAAIPTKNPKGTIIVFNQ
ncbi:hypothetical protein MXB_4266 [Myxobolus squamalis]|nr:hypothetical protein MXB_4266 [Myxobolus squamalis]